MRVFFDDILLSEVSVSMIMNGDVIIVRDMYIRAAVEQQMELGPDKSRYSEGGGGEGVILIPPPISLWCCPNLEVPSRTTSLRTSWYGTCTSTLPDNRCVK